jgi:hypothetical protein
LLTAQLTGGLGNQLFTYARLALHARENGSSLKLDSSVIERLNGHPPDLFDFKLAGEQVVNLSNYGKTRVQLERLLWKNKMSRKIFHRYQDSLLGNQNPLKTDLDGWKVRGFFQDYKVATQYIHEFGKDALTLDEESPSLKFHTLKVEKIKSIAIHMRRGDYLNYKESFGVLSDGYYLQALEKMPELHSYKKILLFSDSPELVKDFQKKVSIELEVISPNDLKTSETLTLMSRCAGIITSNSTFSFWAATLALHQQVIYPDPWFKSTDPWLNSAEFRNPNWISASPDWLN